MSPSFAGQVSYRARTVNLDTNLRRPTDWDGLAGVLIGSRNLVLLCRFHHTSIHHRGFSIERLGSEHAFVRPDGTVIPPAPPSPSADGTEVARANSQLGLEIGPQTIVGEWDGSPLSRFGLDMVVDHLLGKLAVPED